MSGKASGWAWDQELPLGQKMVLLQLADNANGDGVSWWGIEKMAQKCGLSVRSFKRHLSELAATDLVTVRRRPNKSSVYALALPEDGSADLALPDSGSANFVPEVPIWHTEPSIENLEGSSASLQNPLARVRKRDLIWEAFARNFGEPVTKAERANMNAAVKDVKPALVAEGVDIGDEQQVRDAVFRRFSEASAQWPRTFKPTALVLHWTGLVKASENRELVEARRGNGTTQARW